MWAVGAGSLIKGFVFWGPFGTQKEALDFAERPANKNDDCFIIRLHPLPEEKPKVKS